MILPAPPRGHSLTVLGCLVAGLLIFCPAVAGAAINSPPSAAPIFGGGNQAVTEPDHHHWMVADFIKYAELLNWNDLPVDGDIAFRQLTSGNTDGPNWPIFLQFASRYLSVDSTPATK